MITRRRLFLLFLYIIVLVGGWLAGRWLVGLVGFDIQPQNEARVHAMLMVAAGTFIVASAVPFVPGAEIGLGLIVLFGAKIGFLVYVCMVGALVGAFCVGRFIPASLVASAFGYFGLAKSRDLAMTLAPLGLAERLSLLSENAPNRIFSTLLGHRYLALVVLFNLPGNTAIGGGGGIALAAGLSGLYSLPAYVVTVLVAVAPVPLFFALSEFLG